MTVFPKSSFLLIGLHGALSHFSLILSLTNDQRQSSHIPKMTLTLFRTSYILYHSFIHIHLNFSLFLNLHMSFHKTNTFSISLITYPLLFSLLLLLNPFTNSFIHLNTNHFYLSQLTLLNPPRADNTLTVAIHQYESHVPLFQQYNSLFTSYLTTSAWDLYSPLSS